MREMETEISDNTGSDPENLTGVVGTSVITLNRSDLKDCTSLKISNPYGGVRGNLVNRVLYISIDGSNPTTNGETIGIGESNFYTCNIKNGNIKISSNINNTNYEAILVG